MDDRHDSSFLPLGPEHADDVDLSPAMQRCARTLYRQAWRDYRKVGCPYGHTDEAMFVWYSLHDTSPGPSLVTGKN
jgi:hypothetical protein